jgi:hypothetical protein
LEGFIHPQTILDQVRNTAPYLFDGLKPATGRLVSQPGYREILGTAFESPSTAAELQDYFALCLAAHHATVGTFVPTDVDSKIRGLLWKESRDPEALRAMADLALRAPSWSLAGVSTRWSVIPGHAPVSGHNGEWFSVFAGALGRFAGLGDEEYAGKMAAAIDAELRREAGIFAAALRKPGLEIETLCLAMLLTHNVGDLDQGISFWEGGQTASYRPRFGRLAHENTQPYGGVFQWAAKLYKENLSAEGHRHYPLRAVRPLRKSPDLLLPIGPFFDEWGGIIATHAALNAEERGEVLDALVKGCRKVPNQAGYYRAIAGFQQTNARNFEQAAERMPAASRKELRDPALRQRVAVPRRSFESSLGKKVAAMRSAVS